LEKKLKKVEQTALFGKESSVLEFLPCLDESSLTKKLKNFKEILLKHSKIGEKETEVRISSLFILKFTLRNYGSLPWIKC